MPSWSQTASLHNSHEELTAVSKCMARPHSRFHPSDSHSLHHVTVSFSALGSSLVAGFPLPKPTESDRKVLREVEGTDDSLIRLMPNRRVCVLRQIEHVEQRLGHVLKRRDIHKKPCDTCLNLIDEPADA